MSGRVLIVMGSDSDLEIMNGAVQALKNCGVEYEVRISSAHRVPERTAALAREAESRGFQAIIAGAGLAAHLPGVLASFTHLPVIGVPIRGGAIQGIDALYAIVQMPKGIPVATVAINGAYNAGLLAAQIVAVQNPEVREKLMALRAKMAAEVEEKDRRLQELGVEGYLNGGKSND